MIVNRYFTEKYYTNCYLIQSSGSNKALIVDPIDDSDELKAVVRDLNVLYIINTHGHFDHITGNSYFKEETGAKIVTSKEDASMLADPDLNLSTVFSIPVISPPPDLLIES